MERIIVLGTQIIQDAYKNGCAKLDDYLLEYKIDELTDYRLFNVLDKYGTFVFPFNDNIWSTFKLNDKGSLFVESNKKLKYSYGIKGKSWFFLPFGIFVFGFTGTVISVLLHYITLCINKIETSTIIKAFQITTFAIIVFFYFIFKEKENGVKKNSAFLTLTSLILLYMIVYESICLEELISSVTMFVQYGFLGITCCFLIGRK